MVVKVDWPRPAQPALSLGCVISGDEVTHCCMETGAGILGTGYRVLDTRYWVQGYWIQGY